MVISYRGIFEVILLFSVFVLIQENIQLQDYEQDNRCKER